MQNTDHCPQNDTELSHTKNASTLSKKKNQHKAPNTTTILNVTTSNNLTHPQQKKSSAMSLS
jgi:hypothetical protein